VQADRLHAKAREARNDDALDEAQRLASDVTYLRSASADIKRDITIPETPERAFLFSAAYMHMTHGVQRSARLKDTSPQFLGNGPEDSWVTGQEKTWATLLAEAAAAKKSTKLLSSVIERAEVKKATYDLAKKILGKRSAPSGE
jgi:hypothetical protein